LLTSVLNCDFDSVVQLMMMTMMMRLCWTQTSLVHLVEEAEKIMPNELKNI